MTDTLVVLGAAGDLTTRYLLPAAARLVAGGQLPDALRILAVDRAALDDDAYRAHAVQRLAEHAPDLPDSSVDTLRQRLRYAQADVTDAGDLGRILTGLTGPAAVYLALPNTVFGATLQALAAAGLPPGSRLVVEKPFGADRDDARRLNQLIRQQLSEEQVFRIDHFLAKQTVLNLLGFRFANRLFEPVWNSLHIEAVDIVWDETLGLEGRAGYYDRAGALRDMIQNHLLQLLALVAMEPPLSMGERDLRDRKVDVLRAVRSPAPDELRAHSRRARYTAGEAAGRQLPAYTEEPGVDPDRSTETYAELTLHVDNWRWTGVPFRLRTGKALAAPRREMVMRYRPAAHQPFGQEAPADLLRFSMDPDRISLEFNLNGAGDPFDLERECLLARFPAQELPPYSLLLEILGADPTLSIRGDEAEESWRIVEPVLDGWDAGVVPLEEYPAGSAGPASERPA